MSTDNLLGDLKDFKWQNVIDEFCDKAPILVAVILDERNTYINKMHTILILWILLCKINFKAILGTLTKNQKGYKTMKNGSSSVLPLLGSIISQMMYCLKKDMNAFQVCRSLLMWLSGCKGTVSIVCVCVCANKAITRIAVHLL